MKKLKFISLLFALFLIINAFVIPTEEMTLKEALKKNLVTMVATSNGGHSGSCIHLEIRSNYSKALNIKILPGDQFLPEDEDDQTIFITNEQDLIVQKNGVVSKDIEGYCNESSDASPAEGSTFTFDRTRNIQLLDLAKFINKKAIPEEFKQNAVWAVADGENASAIHSELNEQVKALRAEVNKINNQPDVWYNTDVNYEISETREIIKEPVSLKGNLTATIDKAGEVSYAVYDSNGNQKSIRAMKMQLPGAGDYTMKFSLKVEGWDEGTYTVKILFDGISIHEENFEV